MNTWVPAELPDSEARPRLKQGWVNEVTGDIGGSAGPVGALIRGHFNKDQQCIV